MRNRRAAIFTLLFTVSLLALTPAALAQDVPPAPTPTPAPAPVKARITLSFSGLTKSQVLGGNSWTIKGKVSSFVAGQSVTVDVKRAGRKLFTRTLVVKQDGSIGRFSLPMKLSKGGRLTIRASHAATAAMAAAQSSAVGVRVVARYASA